MLSELLTPDEDWTSVRITSVDFQEVLLLFIQVLDEGDRKVPQEN
jgi:hypothetical protein